MNAFRNNTAVLAIASLALVSLGATVSAPAAAAILIFDRGLPTTNLNGEEPDRSNVAWANSSPTVFMGDNFALTGSSYAVDTIRVWVVSRYDLSGSQHAFQLSLGTDSGATSQLTSLPYSSTSVGLVTYAGGSTYQSQDGTFRNLYQVDFGNLGLTLAAGTYAFGVSGPPAVIGTTYTPFLHASNALRSGSPQEGSDGLFYGFTASGEMVAGYPRNSLGNGWDKNSDVNVQVYGAPVPLPAAAWLLISGLGGLGFLRKRKTA